MWPQKWETSNENKRKILQKLFFQAIISLRKYHFVIFRPWNSLQRKYLSTNNNNILLNCILGIGSRVQSHENLIENAMVFFELRVISSSFICKNHFVAKSFIMKWKSNYVGSWWFQERVNLSWFIWLMTLWWSKISIISF